MLKGVSDPVFSIPNLKGERKTQRGTAGILVVHFCFKDRNVHLYKT